MLAKPFRRSVVLLLLLTLACLVPASAAAAGPRDSGARYERAAEAQRPVVTGFWALVLIVAERATAVIAGATTGDSAPAPVTPASGAGLDPNGIR